MGSGWEGSIVDLSVGGMMMRLKKKLTPGSTYVVKLFLEEKVAIVEARVVRAVESEQDRECEVGLQFTAVPMDDAAVLRGFVNG